MIHFLNFTLAIISILAGNPVSQPTQALDGPGGAAYISEEIKISDFATESDGYWLYEPVAEQLDTAHLVVFLHGYGALNPMIYGGWIKHLVKKGNVVVFPRYQKGILSTSPKDFPANTAKAIKDAIEYLKKDGLAPVYTDRISFVGHSYGGVISAHLAARHQKYELPFPQSVMLCSPGSGPFKGAVLDEYSGIPASTRLLIMFSDRDHVVGDKFSYKVFNTATQVKDRNLIKQYSDPHGDPGISSGHNESYSIDEELDSGLRNVTTKRALRIGETNAVDYFGYWKLFDALNSCTWDGAYCEYAFGNTVQQSFLGNWSDGTAVRALEVLLP